MQSSLACDYPEISIDEWPTTPVTLPINKLTGRSDGDDAGYRDVPTRIAAKVEPLVRLDDMHTTPEFDGVDMYGRDDLRMIRAGGINGGGILVRETMARILVAMNNQIKRVFAGAYELVPVDGYRSAERQKAIWDMHFLAPATIGSMWSG